MNCTSVNKYLCSAFLRSRLSKVNREMELACLATASQATLARPAPLRRRHAARRCAPAPLRVVLRVRLGRRATGVDGRALAAPGALEPRFVHVALENSRVIGGMRGGIGRMRGRRGGIRVRAMAGAAGERGAEQERIQVGFK